MSSSAHKRLRKCHARLGTVPRVLPPCSASTRGVRVFSCSGPRSAGTSLTTDEHGEHRDLRGLSRWSVISYVYGRDECCITVCLLKSRLSLLEVSLPILTSAQPFIAQGLDSYIETRGRQVAPG
jgi:hypothetical protein